MRQKRRKSLIAIVFFQTISRNLLWLPVEVDTPARKRLRRERSRRWSTLPRYHMALRTGLYILCCVILRRFRGWRGCPLAAEIGHQATDKARGTWDGFFKGIVGTCCYRSCGRCRIISSTNTQAVEFVIEVSLDLHVDRVSDGRHRSAIWRSGEERHRGNTKRGCG